MSIENLLRSKKFKQALFNVHTEESEQFAAAVKPVDYSPAFERKMDRLIRAQRKPYFPLVNTSFKRAFLAATIAVIMLITMVFSVSALREPVVRFFVEVYETFSQVVLHHEPEDEFPAMLETYYEPTWLPSGYQEKVDQRVDAAIFCEWTYMDDNGNALIFKQYTITSTALLIDTEGTQSEQVTVNGNAALFYSNKDIQHLMWSDGAYGYLVSGAVTKEELYRIAESILAVE